MAQNKQKQLRGFKGSWGVFLFYVKILPLKLLICMMFLTMCDGGWVSDVCVGARRGWTPLGLESHGVVSHQCAAGPLAEQKLLEPDFQQTLPFYKVCIFIKL